MHRILTIINHFSKFSKVRKVYSLLVIIMLLCIACEWRLKSNEEISNGAQVDIERYDRIEGLYLTTGDYSALLQMNKTYPMQTRTLIEDVLQLGQVNDPEINNKFLHFFRDSTLQRLINDVQEQYANIDDLNRELTDAFGKLKDEIPSIEFPEVYSQIGSFDQSIIVGNKMLGISLDKYLGADYPFYVEHYTPEQRKLMTRSMITPDCLSFYLLSLFPMPSETMTQDERDMHMGKIQWVVNQVTDRQVFDNRLVSQVDSFMNRNKEMSMEQLLHDNNYSELRR